VSDERSEVERLAELVCLMVGWTPLQSTERGKALYELWSDWHDAYKAAGGSTLPKDHPELSKDRIKKLAARRDATFAQVIETWSEKRSTDAR